ncbi:hypothetical protein [Agreia sp. VKM Ac-1783]|uniref:hypothetical protein n=1 Tax=Agreia sp. VKM Ac-1783 TaxID=1938889 RepID=UPI000A38BD16|nr:hypothetical protein [Agreia sp. VKM Ac-1783]
MPNASPLPHDLDGRPFSVSDARRRGVTRSRLRASDLYAPFHGARLPSTSRSLRERCMAWQSVAPEDSHVSHSTAALLYGCPLPRRLETTSDIQ